MIDFQNDWPGIATFFTFLLSIFCSGHAILYKSDSKAATGWVGVIWLVPLIGSILYYFLGINRVRRLAKVMRQRGANTVSQKIANPAKKPQLEFTSPDASLVALARLGGKITGRPLLPFNEVIPLINGEEAYPRMLNAISEATRSISLSTYIFDKDAIGKLFVDALGKAVSRGVIVKVLIDDIGLRYSWRSVLKSLSRSGIDVARFMGALRPLTFPHFNLRKHRKILIVDGKTAFTGGMNIREGHMLTINTKYQVADLHFEIRGPLINQLQEVFVEDWAFTTLELLQGDIWFGDPKSTGQTWSRAISEGPDEDLFKLSLIIEGAISYAKKSVWILTPYFLPDASMVRALCIAANKGVAVNIVLPNKNNLPFVQWASNPILPSLLEHGCRIWFSPPPFDHSKLILVDDTWVLLGSANLDPRSLRLNFELNVECYDKTLAKSLMKIVSLKLRNAKLLSRDEILRRSLPLRLRDGVARLFSPYL